MNKIDGHYEGCTYHNQVNGVHTSLCICASIGEEARAPHPIRYTDTELKAIVRDAVKDAKAGQQGKIRFQSYVLILGPDGSNTLQVHCQQTLPNGETWSFAHNVAI